MFLFVFKETFDFKEPVFDLKWLKSVVFEDDALTDVRVVEGVFNVVLAFVEVVQFVDLIAEAFVVFVVALVVEVEEHFFVVAHFVFFEQFVVS